MGFVLQQGVAGELSSGKGFPHYSPHHYWILCINTNAALCMRAEHYLGINVL